MGLTILLASAFLFLAYLSYAPPLHPNAPPFTSDKNLLIGSYGFFTKRWSFFKDSREHSKTGQFSFWLGKNHVVGITGEKARRGFLENRNLDFVSGAPLHGVGPESVPPIHDIYVAPAQGHSYFQRRVLDIMQPEYLTKRLPLVTKDACDYFSSMRKNSSGMINPIGVCYRLVLQQSSRVMCADDIAEAPVLLDSYVNWTTLLLHVSSGHTMCTPWLPSIQHMKRMYGRWGMKRLVTPIVEKRTSAGAHHGEDALQMMVDKGDSKDYMITFFINALFISVAHSGKLAGAVLNMLANHTDWQDTIYGEIQATANKYATNKDLPLDEQLNSFSLEAWESLSSFIEILFKEVLRLHIIFPMVRQNVGSSPVPISGTKYVIPVGSFAAYNTGDAHFDEKLYPNPQTLNPLRFAKEHDKSKKETYAFLGWGNGRHRCVGQRWAKLQQNIIIAYALAMYQWSACDANGQSVGPSDHKTDFDKHSNKLPQGIFLKHVPR
ncbi:cytochrome P450 [Lophiotrema nucula]|uniref:Cytochrome P450 n=1 Tax=Lophiotrema nucula TaxID=690887 RepID=A0A6A5ZJ07_9PLEO|nr:cytochrome P450 [Lophiotrema nucula]